MAWTYDTGDAAGGAVAGADMQVNPLVVDGKLYLVSPKGRVISLDAATGRERWVFDPAGTATTCSAIRWWRSTRPPASACGIFRARATTCGTATWRRRRRW